MNPMLHYELHKTNHEELIRKAAQRRLIKTALSDQQSILNRLKAQVGDFLIRIGSRLQRLPTPQNPPINSRYIV